MPFMKSGLSRTRIDPRSSPGSFGARAFLRLSSSVFGQRSAGSPRLCGAQLDRRRRHRRPCSNLGDSRAASRRVLASQPEVASLNNSSARSSHVRGRMTGAAAAWPAARQPSIATQFTTLRCDRGGARTGVVSCARYPGPAVFARNDSRTRTEVVAPFHPSASAHVV